MGRVRSEKIARPLTAAPAVASSASRRGAADLIAVETDDIAPPTGHAPGIARAATAWTDLMGAVAPGRITGSCGQVRLLRAAASLADGRPIDLGDTTSGLDRRHLQLLLASISHAGGSHEDRGVDHGDHRGNPVPPLVPWRLGSDRIACNVGARSRGMTELG